MRCEKNPAAQVLHDWVVRLHILFYLIKIVCVCVCAWGFICVWVQTLETAVDGDELVFLYQLKEGICQSSYAANIATLAGLPPSLVQRGVEVDICQHTAPQMHVHIDWVRLCLGRCLNSTAPGSLSNDSIQHLQMSSQTGLSEEKGWVKGWEAYPVTICGWQIQICGGEVPQSWPGWQRFRPSALYEGGASALCRRAAESQLNLHGRHIFTALWFVESL